MSKFRLKIFNKSKSADNPSKANNPIPILENFDELPEEPVEVNQRLLVDKILARYSSEYVIYRELMQNSDDARSERIQIIFETENTKDKVTRIKFKNDGSSFAYEDWQRLKKIAEGNPDAKKIGAFGVGFYSLFSICDNPIVFSGGRVMAFSWRGNQLFTKHGQTDDCDKDWTTFLMYTKKPIKIPDIEKFANFLANSLAFTENIIEISVYLNRTPVIQLSKKMPESKSLHIESKFNKDSPEKMFKLISATVKNVQMDVAIITNLSTKRLNSNKYQEKKTTIYFGIVKGELDVKIDDEFSLEMERLIKKSPPIKTTIQIIFTRFDENSSPEDHNISSVFKDLLSYPEQGKIYIGSSTDQTIGCCSHLAAHVIPTMERVSIDLANETLAKYNYEMLSLAGTLCRILYEKEMNQISQLYNKKVVGKTENEEVKSIRETLEKRAAYTLTYFTFIPSKPHEKVGEIIESRFFECLKQKLSILSTNGVCPISDARLPNPEMAGFIKNVPVLPKIISGQCEPFFKKAKGSLNLIRELNFQDVLVELKSRTISNKDEIVDLFKWWICYLSKRDDDNNDTSEFKQFMHYARIGDKSQALNTINFFQNQSIIPSDMDVPNNVLPCTIFNKLKVQESRNKGSKIELTEQNIKKWFGWSELPLVDWAKFIVSKPDLEVEPKFAERVHEILGKEFNKMSNTDKDIIYKLFKKKKCIPTTSEMKIPSEAYFENVSLFPDLPTIKFRKPSKVKNLMEHLGVRKMVDLNLIFKHQKNFDHTKLLKYFSSRLKDLKEDEIKTLSNKPIWPKRNSAEDGANRETRFIARDLYIPIATNCEFGLPVIDLNKGWARNSPEGKFLIELGLQEYPSLKKILELAAPPTDPKIRDKAFKYFNDNFEKNYSKDYDPNKIDTAFIPCSKERSKNYNSSEKDFAKPLECFINPECMIMDFKVIRQDLQLQVVKLGVRQDPIGEVLVNRLKKIIEGPPKYEVYKKILKYLASQQGIFTEPDWTELSILEFIRIPKNGKIEYKKPQECFLKVQKKLDKPLEKFLNRVCFGEKVNKFLQSCGVKSEPNAVNFAELLVESSNKLWESLKKDEKIYSSILSRIAIDFEEVKANEGLLAKMKTRPILIAMKRRCFDSDIDEKNNELFLTTASKIFINDDLVYQQIFNPFAAPEDELLEDMYKKLGCKTLKESVKEKTSIPKGAGRSTESSMRWQEIITKRASLFYHEISKYNNIKHDEKWFKMLKVKEIDDIETIYTLRDSVKTKKIDAIIQKPHTLFITSKTSPLSISQQIVKNIYSEYKWKEVFCINTLLTTSLLDMKSMGYPVGRILRQEEEFNQSNQFNQKKNNQHSIVSNRINPHEIIPGYFLDFVGNEQGIDLYNKKNTLESIRSQSRAISLSRFINILKDLAKVFKLSLKVFNIFYHDDTDLPAFINEGDLFFNYAFYFKLHDCKCLIKPSVESMFYWFMVIHHLLEHKSTSESELEDLFSSVIEMYMPNFLKLIA